MYRHQKPLSLASGAVVIFLCERGAEAMWPETPAWTWWSLAVVVADRTLWTWESPIKLEVRRCVVPAALVTR